MAAEKKIRDTRDQIRVLEMKQIADLEKQHWAAEEVYHHAINGVKVFATKVELLKSKQADPKLLQQDLETLARYQQVADSAALKVKLLKDKLDKLNVAKLNADKKLMLEPKNTSPAEVADIDKKLDELKKRWADLQAEADSYKKRFDALATELKAVNDMADVLQKRRADLAKQPAANVLSGGYLELTIHGKQAFFQYSVKEVDVNGKVIGRVIVEEPEMLQKLLARTRKDPAAPNELRVIVDPSMAQNGSITVAFKACDSAGFSTVKFTGYMPKDGIPPLGTQVGPDWRGEGLQAVRRSGAHSREPHQGNRGLDAYVVSGTVFPPRPCQSLAYPP